MISLEILYGILLNINKRIEIERGLLSTVPKYTFKNMLRLK